jgi:hypothetical protein
MFKRVNKAFVAICRHKQLGFIIYWVDNLHFLCIPINFSPPWWYSFTLDNILYLADYLGIPLPCEKVREFSSFSCYFGLLWGLDVKTVSLLGGRTQSIHRLQPKVDWRHLPHSPGRPVHYRKIFRNFLMHLQAHSGYLVGRPW